jgi:hypothetical protein
MRCTTLFLANEIIPIFLCGVRDTDITIQASSLANLAEICELMGSALFPFIEEIVLTVSDIINLHQSPEVRRGKKNLICIVITKSLFILRNCRISSERKFRCDFGIYSNVAWIRSSYIRPHSASSLYNSHATSLCPGTPINSFIFKSFILFMIQFSKKWLTNIFGVILFFFVPFVWDICVVS